MIFLVRCVRHHGALPCPPSSHHLYYKLFAQVDDTDVKKDRSESDKFDYRSYIQKESIEDSSADLL